MVRFIFSFVLLLAITLSLMCWHHGVWSWHDWQVYQLMSKECHPVSQELHVGRVYQGQAVEEVLATMNPERVGRIDRIISGLGGIGSA